MKVGNRVWLKAKEKTLLAHDQFDFLMNNNKGLLRLNNITLVKMVIESEI